MNILKYLALSVFIISGCVNKPGNAFKTENIDDGWQFHLGDVENGEKPGVNTSSWRDVSLPHDWSIEGEYSQDHGTDWQSGYLPTGIGWYRKVFNWEPGWKGKNIKIHFEGIYLNSDVWINGHHLGHRPNGYIGFEYDLTKYLKDGENILAVRVDHSKPLTGRWYTGSGIYRHVWLKVRSPLHISNWGVCFRSPEVDAQKSTFEVQVSIENQYAGPKTFQVKSRLLDKSGFEVATVYKIMELGKEAEDTIMLKGIVPNPCLWSPDSPNLYTLETSIIHDGELVDQDMQKVGFRKLEFSSEFGFKINGVVTKMKGVCDHHTAGSVGAAVPDDVWVYRLKLLKKMGCNAIRTAHNPFSPSFYDMCDSLGIMVMNEFLDGWDTEKADHDYGLYFEEWWEKDGEDFIKRDRNHPSVVMWSLGNEVKKPTREVQMQLIDLFHKHDPTRPVTQGGHDPTRGMKGNHMPSLLDIKGFNGDGEEKNVLERFHAREPDIPMVCTEVPHTYQTRGVYRTETHWRRRDFPAPWELGKWNGSLRGLEKRLFEIPDLAKPEVFSEETSTTYYKNGEEFLIEFEETYQPYLYYQSSYDNASVRSSARMAWQRTRDLPYVMGQFRWGSFDYLGETNKWPSRFANFGIIDICGFPKDHYYLYQSMWDDKPMVHLLPHWTHPGKEGVKIPVVAYTNCDEVELFLNGKFIGKQKYKDEQLVWMVPYEKGTIKAIAKNGGKIVAQHSHTTSGKPAKARLNPDKVIINANKTDVVHLAVDIVDENGVFCPKANNVVTFEINGPGKIIGIDNGDPLDLSFYKTNTRRAFRGKIMVLVQAGDAKGEINIKAISEGLQGQVLSILVQ